LEKLEELKFDTFEIGNRSDDFDVHPEPAVTRNGIHHDALRMGDTETQVGIAAVRRQRRFAVRAVDEPNRAGHAAHVVRKSLAQDPASDDPASSIALAMEATGSLHLVRGKHVCELANPRGRSVQPRPPQVDLVVQQLHLAAHAAAAATNLARTVAAAATPALTGWVMQVVALSAPFALGGLLKMVYDLLLWTMFRHVKLTDSG